MEVQGSIWSARERTVIAMVGIYLDTSDELRVEVRELELLMGPEDSEINQFYLEYSEDMHCMRGVSGKETSSSQKLRNWKIWTRQKFMLEDSIRGRSSCRKMVNISYS